MAKNIYVGNLPYETTSDDLVELFQPYGSVISAQVVMDRFSGRSRGFGFVEMADDGEAQAAIDALNGQPYGSRPLTVNEARPRTDAPRRGGGGGGGYGGGGGDGGGRHGCRRWLRRRRRRRLRRRRRWRRLRRRRRIRQGSRRLLSRAVGASGDTARRKAPGSGPANSAFSASWPARIFYPLGFCAPRFVY